MGIDFRSDYVFEPRRASLGARKLIPMKPTAVNVKASYTAQVPAETLHIDLRHTSESAP